jgi:diguanylate cyclase (GGDEF)-like protein
MTDLERQVAAASAEQPAGLILFDLDGFKAYNDTFGHPAGDALLVRLAHRLSERMEGRASTYRMGGDEFCVLVAGGPEAVQAASVDSADALSESGEGFTITTSFGVVLVPSDTGDAPEALILADRRMYANKSRGRASAGHQIANVLMRVLSERNPDLAAHLDDVSRLSDDVSRRMGLPDEDRMAVIQAASLHDVGKTAIPDELLNKPGPLSDEEWEFMRQHTVIGERILSAAPALCEAARLVRASHERFDGTGYPDGLAGDDIPLGARIVAVCDAYDAMTSDRPYRRALGAEQAIAELRLCAGTQFDPAVVEAFSAAIDEAGELSVARPA